MKLHHIALMAAVALLGLTACDKDADNIKFEDVSGTYEGEGQSTIIVGAEDGIDIGGIHFDYGDVLVPPTTASDPIFVSTYTDTDGEFVFATSVPRIALGGKRFRIHILAIDNIPVDNKGNRIVTWGQRHLETYLSQLNINTCYVDIQSDYLVYQELDDNDEPVGDVQVAGIKGIFGLLMGNYNLYMDLYIKEITKPFKCNAEGEPIYDANGRPVIDESQPSLLNPDLCLNLSYDGVMRSREVSNKRPEG